MRPLTYIEIGAAALVVIVGAVALHEHDAHIREQAVADAVEKAQGQFQKQLQQINETLDAKIKARDDQHAQETKTLQDEFTVAAKSNAQMSALLQKLTGAPQPFIITTPAATAANPTPSPVVAVPQADFPAVSRYAQSCEQSKLDLTNCTADAADRATKMTNAQKEIDSLKKENKQLAETAKGGNWIHRTTTSLLVAACAGGGGYAASPRGSTAAGIGAAAGAIVCTLAVR